MTDSAASTGRHMSLQAPAKINLFLHVVGRRADGYHLLQSVFQLIDLADTLHFDLRDDGQIVLAAPLSGVAPEDDLCVRAARLLERAARRPMPGATITVDKRIPMGGGLGGGSSDAATTLLALNHLWALGLSRAQLAELGLALGADVPFFIGGSNAWVEGIGEQLTPLQLPQRWFLVVHPGVGVATPTVFKAPDLTRNTPSVIISDFVRAASASELFGRNDLQPVAERLEPAVKLAAQALPGSRMSGSGACVFAAFDNEAAANAALHSLRERNALPAQARMWVVKGLDQYPAAALAQ
ncbi:MAG TPA: 4-(cytidine 5'-diphospho)-2-C-methyl-D-erythritol kinase [Burkholderiaceae bacterium]|nr:4-(cytidine 5'-diphospho)-2-C-methyl-D-erythritol kinase [Burkholderiaceae bacterium]